MTSAYNKSLVISDIQIKNNVAKVLCQSINYHTLTQRTAVGESITTNEPFELRFPDPIGISKWILVFFPKGQYDYGNESQHSRIYIKMIFCENEMIDMNIDVSIKTILGVVHAKQCDIKFILNDVYRQWVGPFNLRPIILNSLTTISIKCVFELISKSKGITSKIKRHFIDFSGSSASSDQQLVLPKKNRTFSSTSNNSKFYQDSESFSTFSKEKKSAESTHIQPNQSMSCSSKCLKITDIALGYQRDSETGETVVVKKLPERNVVNKEFANSKPLVSTRIHYFENVTSK